jgi:hypothetical protein
VAENTSQLHGLNPLDTSDITSIPEAGTPNGRYHDALDALLLLGADDPGIELELPLDDSLDSPARLDERSKIDRIALGEDCEPQDDKIAMSDIKLEQEVLSLMKYWRYEIATWVSLSRQKTCLLQVAIISLPYSNIETNDYY